MIDAAATLRIERGAPTAEELAAVTAVLAALGAAADIACPDATVVSLASWRRRERFAAFEAPASWRRVS